MARIGVLGGSFNPPHLGHLFMADRAREQHGLDRVLFVPALHPPHRQPKVLASAEHRLCMVDLAVAGKPAFEVDTIELEREAPSYTLVTVRELREKEGPGAALFLILGTDSLTDLRNWWHAGELVDEVEIITVERPSSPFAQTLALFERAFGSARAGALTGLKVDGTAPGISSTAIREKAAAGESIEGLVPEGVRAYIIEHDLYSRR